MSRPDRRLPNDMRSVSSQKGFSLCSQGSSRLKIGNTEVIVNIVGPKECRFREIDTGKAIIRVKTFPETNELNDIVETAVSNSLDCEAYPDTFLDVGITIVCDDGSLASCAINATMLALIDAQYKLNNTILASSFAFKDNEILIDPSKREEEATDGYVTFVYTHDDKHSIIATYYQGNILPAMMLAAISRATCVENLLEPILA